MINLKINSRKWLTSINSVCLTCVLLVIIILNIAAQSCQYPSGDITLTANQVNPDTSLYAVAFIIGDESGNFLTFANPATYADSSASATFIGVASGNYTLYGVSYLIEEFNNDGMPSNDILLENYPDPDSLLASGFCFDIQSFSASVCDQTDTLCHNSGDSLVMVQTAPGSYLHNSTFTQTYVAFDDSGIIQQTSSTAVFAVDTAAPGLLPGTYYAYAINYSNLDFPADLAGLDLDSIKLLEADTSKYIDIADTFTTLVVLDCCSEFSVTRNDTTCNGDTLFVGTSSYTASGSYVDTMMKQDGCDSIVSTILTVLPTSLTTDSLYSCDLEQIGTVTQVLVNSYGCDSTVVTVTSLLPSSSTLLSLNSCNPEDTGSIAVVLSNVFGCDSTVVTATSLLAPSLTIIDTTICIGTIYEGTIYNTNSTLRDTLVAANSCDSIVVTNLTVQVCSFIGDYVWYDVNGNGFAEIDEPGLEGVKIKLHKSTGYLLDSTESNSLGLYFFSNVPPDDCYIAFESPGGYLYTSFQSLGSKVTGANGTGTTNTFSAVVTGVLTIDAGFIGAGNIGDLVFDDLNDNGVFDGVDSGFADVALALTWFGMDGASGGGDDIIFNDTSDPTGAYAFEDLPPGNFNTSVAVGLNTNLAGYRVTTINNPTSDTLVPITAMSNTAVDFGFQLDCPTPSLTNTSNITSSSAKLNWALVPGALGYRVYYGTLLAPLSNTIDISGGSVNYRTINLLLPLTSYAWSVIAICDNSPEFTSGFAPTKTFTTSPLGRLQASSNAVTTFVPVPRIRLLPNPNKGQFEIELENAKGTSNVRVDICNMAGLKILSNEYVLDEAEPRINMHVGDRGVYMVRVLINGMQTAERLVVF